VELGGAALSDPEGRQIAVAVAVGLLVGKLAGIAGATFVALKLRLGRLPAGVDMRGLLGAAALGGIGFTVSLFIAPLAYSSPVLVEGAKLGIFAASVVATLLGAAIFLPGGRHHSR
jgi:NhaA family Na+:H+ antiporter